MGSITSDIIKQVYPLAKGLHKKKGDAIEKLYEDAEMNRNSANYYIQAVVAMLEGRRYEKRTSDKATRIFLEKISEDFGKEGLKTALLSLRQHIIYCEADEGKRLEGLRKIYREFRQRLGGNNENLPDTNQHYLKRAERLAKEAERLANEVKRIIEDGDY